MHWFALIIERVAQMCAALESGFRCGDILLSACDAAGNFETFRRLHKIKRVVTQKCSPSRSSYVEYRIPVRLQEIHIGGPRQSQTND